MGEATAIGSGKKPARGATLGRVMGGNQPMHKLAKPLVGGAALLAAGIAFPAAATASDAEERFEIAELMDRYGVVHDFGSPEEYADLFTPDGEMAISGTPVVIKGREALMEQARRDHERYVAPTGPNGENVSFMRHIITNRVVTLTGQNAAEGSCYVITMIHDGDNGPVLMSFGRYIDRYVKVGGDWKIAHRDIKLEFGNQALAKKLGFR
jgi:hypothetical protein